MRAFEKLLSLSNINACATAAQHFCSIVLGSGNGETIYIKNQANVLVDALPEISTIAMQRPEIIASTIVKPEVNVLVNDRLKVTVQTVEKPLIKVTIKCPTL